MPNAFFAAPAWMAATREQSNIFSNKQNGPRYQEFSKHDVFGISGCAENWSRNCATERFFLFVVYLKKGEKKDDSVFRKLSGLDTLTRSLFLKGGCHGQKGDGRATK